MSGLAMLLMRTELHKLRSLGKIRFGLPVFYFRRESSFDNPGAGFHG